jgi:hypothetical protein
VQLPFLVVHAALVWKVVLVAFVALCVATFLAIRYALVRAANRAAMRELDTTDEGVVRGTLRGGVASTLYVASTVGPSKQPSFHAGDLEIETADGTVALDSEIRVAAGSRVAARRRQVPDPTPAELAKLHSDSTDTTIATAVLHQVHPGDDVIAKGTLVREAGDEATGYRENATRRVLRGSIVIAARTPATKLVRPRLPILGVVIAISTFVGYKVENVCGDTWRDTCRGGGDLELTNSNACVMANAMPNQAMALDRLLDQLDRKAAPTETALQERIALARLVESCRESVSRLERIARPELVLEEARRCGDYEAQEIALAELGRFAEAAAMPAPLDGYNADVRGKILVMADAWGPAAAYAEQRAADLKALPAEDNSDRRESLATQIVEWQCIAALMQFYADGNATSTARIRELAAGPHGKECLPELAEIATGAERTKLLTARYDLDVPWRTLELESQLAGLGMMKNDGIPATLLQGSDAPGMAYAPVLWATRIAPSVPATAELEQRFDDVADRLAIAVWMHDYTAAHHYADQAIALGGDVRAGYDAQFLALFHPMIDLYTAKTPLEVPSPPNRDDGLDHALAGIWMFMTPRLAIRHGDELNTNAFVVTKEMRDAMTAAQHGDGAPLAATLGEESLVRPLDLVAVLPLVRTHRDQLVRALAWIPVQSQVVDYRFPFGTAQYYAERRTMFELAGDTANAKRVGDVFDRYVEAFHDHRRLVALALLDL